MTLRLDATQIRVRRPRAGRPGRKAFVSGKVKQNTIKATVVADEYGANLWCGGHRPGRMHDTTAASVEVIDALPAGDSAGRRWLPRARQGVKPRV
ncbi:transposase family protein [Micromonospora sp. LZ34]